MGHGRMRKTGAWLLIFLLLASGLAGFFIFTPTKGQEYINHAPIVIDGNEDFAFQATNESWPGDGSEGNPYMIEGYEFNTTGLIYINSYIVISNTDVFFIIRNVNMYSDYGRPTFGIALYNVSYGNIENITLTDVHYGLNILDCSGITIIGNDLSDSTQGLRIIDSTNTTIMNNTFGINGISIEGESFEEFHSHTITPDNLVNGTPIQYYKDLKDVNISDMKITQLIIINCSDVMVSNITISNANYGFLMAFVTDMDITKNMISSRISDGIRLVSSNKVNIYDNDILFNTRVGIKIHNSKNITINNNNISGNSDGIEIHNSNNITIADNIASINDHDGIKLYDASNITLFNNSIAGNRQDGILLIYSTNVHIHNNNFLHMTSEEIKSWKHEEDSNWWYWYGENQHGIKLFFSQNVSLSNNSFESNGINIVGHDIDHFNSHSISSENLINGKPVLYFKDEENINIDNIPVGQLILANCSDLNIANLSISNTDVGLILAFVDNSRIFNCNISSNGIYGIYLHETTDLDFIDNIVWENVDGIEGTFSGNITFINNTGCCINKMQR